MNFNLYLDRDSAERIARVARNTGRPRNALVREAVRTWLDRNAAAWPKEVLGLRGDPSLVPFESRRAELRPEPGDPFASSSRSTTSRRRRARQESR